MSTEVTYTKSFEKQLSKCPWYIREKALVWIDTVETHGIREVRIRPGYAIMMSFKG